MGQFLNELQLSPLPGGFLWQLLREFDYDDDVFGVIAMVPPFESDLGSVPRILQGMIPNNGPLTRAYFVHDWLYAHQQVNGEPITRKDADMCLWRAMAICDPGNEHEFARLTVYEGVRFGGQEAWDGDAAKNGLLVR